MPTFHSHIHCQAAQATAKIKAWQQRVSVPTRNRQNIKTKEEHRTDNRRLAATAGDVVNRTFYLASTFVVY